MSSSSQSIAAKIWRLKIYFCGHQWIFFCIFAADPVWHHCCKWDHGHFSSYHRPSGHEDKVCFLHIHVFLPYTILANHWEPCQAKRSKPAWALFTKQLHETYAVLSEKDRTNPQWYSHVHKKVLRKNEISQRWMGWEVRLWQRNKNNCPLYKSHDLY